MVKLAFLLILSNISTHKSAMLRTNLICSFFKYLETDNPPPPPDHKHHPLPATITTSSYLPRSLADRWGTTVDFTTSFLHSSRFSAFRSSIFHSRPVHSLLLSSHRFLCLPLRPPPPPPPPPPPLPPSYFQTKTSTRESQGYLGTKPTKL